MATQLGDYVLGERIAAGGMAEIYRAEIRGLGGFKREVAIKKILPEHTHDDAFVAMLLDEARIAARLQHPNIAQVIQCGCVDGNYFIVMELVDGVALSKILSLNARRDARLQQPTAVHAGVQLLRALDFAHKAKNDDGKPLSIVHRDVSPQNLLVSVHGDVKLVDFGVASAADRLHKTESGVLKGKLSYMAPEQVEGKGVDARSDQYAAALVVAEALTGKRVFAGHSEIDVIKAVLDGRIDNIEQNLRDASVASGAIDAVLKALARNPAERFDDCDAFANALRAAVSVDVDAARQELAAAVVAVRTEPPRTSSFASEHDDDTEAPTKRLKGDTSKPSMTAPSEAPTELVPLASRRAPAPKKARGPLVGIAAAAVAFVVVAAVIVVARNSKNDALPIVDAKTLAATKPETPIAPVAPNAHAVTSVDAGTATSASAQPSTPEKAAVAPSTQASTTASATSATTAASATSAATGARVKAKAGLLDLACLPWCEITIDGKSTGLRSPLQGHALSAGAHVVDVVNPPSGKRDTKRIEIKANETTKVGFRLD